VILAILIITLVFAFHERKRALRENRRRILENLIFSPSALSEAAANIPCGVFSIDIPTSVVIEDGVLSEAIDAVKSFNASEKQPTEQSYSIENPRSVHHLWNRLICLAGSDHLSQSHEGFRVVYEWPILHPMNKTTTQRIDFTIISKSCSQLNWLDYAGGIELKVSKKNAHSNSSMNNVRFQAISRAAMCVYARFEATGWSPVADIRAYCIFADSEGMCVARVTVSSNLDISLDISSVIKLPGAGNGRSKDATALRLLRHVLCSPPDQLLDFSSLPLKVSGDAPLCGISSATRNCETWTRSEYLGSGGFGYVCAGGVINGCQSVVKTSITDKGRTMLANEAKVLETLTSKLDDTWSEKGKRCSLVASLINESRETIALRLLPRGVSLVKFLQFMPITADLLKRLVNFHGPKMVAFLEAAHSANIYHGDIRLPNLILVPSDGVMTKIATFQGDTRSEFPEITKLEIENCGLVLIDWGHGSTNKNKNKKKASADLINLVNTLTNPLPMTSVSNVSSSSDMMGKTATIAKTSGILRARESDKIDLEQLASIMDYDKLKLRFKEVAFNISKNVI
jgi:hypothetical protein